jgi:hypothetical protein
VFEDYITCPMDSAPESLLTDICLPLADEPDPQQNGAP